MKCLQNGGWVCSTRNTDIDIQGACEFQRDVNEAALSGPKQQLFPVRMNTLTAVESINPVCMERRNF
jgi:hypothetical protein